MMIVVVCVAYGLKEKEEERKLGTLREKMKY
jgi:hypothetical protein